MSYGLGVDLGTTHTAAAVNVDGRVDTVRLGSQKPEMPSVVFLRPDGGVLVGEAAQRRGQLEPARLAREFKRRMGDPVPIMLGGAPLSAHALTARLLGQVIETITQTHGGAPDRIVVTHPANWGPYKRELLTQAVQLADARDATLRSEPEAAAVRYAGTERVAAGEIIAVYDLGGGTFDAAVLRKSTGGFDLLGKPEGIEQLGGIDFDEAVLEHVRATLGDALGDLEREDEDTNAGLARLRRDCIEAKETLSYDTEAIIPVALPRLHTRVRINRSQFEAMIAPTLDDTVAAMRRALRSADVRPEQLRSIVLTGGSARIPLVSEVLSTAFERRVTLDEAPELGIALGAAMLTAPPGAQARPWPPSGSAPVGPSPPVVATTRVDPAPVPAPSGATAATGRALAADRAAGAEPAGAPARPAGPASEPAPRERNPIVGRAPAPAPFSATRVDGVAAPVPTARTPWKRYRWQFIGGVVAAVLVVTATTAWPRDDASPAGPAPSTPASTPVARQLWQATTGSPATGPPVASVDRVFVGGADGVIRAFRRSDGHPQWTFPTGSGAVFVSRVLDERVYAGTASGVLYAVDARTGEQRWRKEVGDRLVAPPSVHPNHVYVGDRSGVLHSYARDGGRLWRYRTGGEIRTSPASVGDLAVVASRDGRLYAVNTKNVLVWKSTVGQVTATPAGVGRAVCVGLDNGSISCRNTDDGTEAARITSAGNPLSAPLGADRMVVAAAADGTVAAWDALTGDQRWRLPPAGGVSGPVRLAMREGMLHGVDADGRLFAIDPAGGAERWRFDLGDRVDVPPWAEGGALFAVGTTGTLHALRVPPSPYASATPSPR
jgi:outer membrane protein assembly factor BamB/actin-like ATPase involved in cell morphogenesis